VVRRNCWQNSWKAQKLSESRPRSWETDGGAQKLIGDLQNSEIARFFVVLPDLAESPFAFLIEQLIG
jgi:hypothetical protein